MDDAFLPLHRMIEQTVPLGREIRDEEAGVNSYIYACSIETPVELDVVRDEDGALRIGCVPPLYRVSTSVLPVFHNIRFTAELNKSPDEGEVPDGE
jgi:hypothetical protein